MFDILTVTLNPALDMSSAVTAVVPGDKLRCATPSYDPGGGGINVARAVHLLGGEAQAFVAVAGYRGAQLVELLRGEGVSVVAHKVPGETRLSLAVTDQTAHDQYRFVMPGPDWDSAMQDAVLTAIGQALTVYGKGAYLVLSGSQPPGIEVDFPARLAELAKLHGAKLVLDTSGEPLEALLKGPPAGLHVLRLDGAESEVLAGGTLAGRDKVAQFAASLVERQVADMVVLAMGADGSILATQDGCWHALTPQVPVESKVGAGDSFVGAFTMALASGAGSQEALTCGVAAASAAVMSDATKLCRATDYHTLCQQVQVKPVG